MINTGSATYTGFVTYAGSMINTGLTVPEVPQMNVWTGAGSIFALFGNYYRPTWLAEPQADTLAILGDWVRVGRDISRAIEKFEAETGAKPDYNVGQYRIPAPNQSQQDYIVALEELYAFREVNRDQLSPSDFQRSLDEAIGACEAKIQEALRVVGHLNRSG